MINTLLLIALLAALPQNSPAVATLQGLVTSAGTGSPLPDAGVELISTAPDANRYIVATGSDGTFSFRNIPPGDYRIAAARSGFVRTEYGQRGSEGTGRTVTLSAGDAVKDIRVALVETGAISGRVLDSKGLPIANAQVQALQFMNIGATRFVETVTAAITNDLGEYRLFWLPPDDYIVMAMPIRGSIEDTLLKTDGNGYTVNNRIRPGAGALIPAPTEVPPMPFFFRDGYEPANASPISVRSAENIRGIDITIRPPATYTIRGKLVNAPTNPPTPVPGRPFRPEADSLRIELAPRTAPAVRFLDSMPNGLVVVNVNMGTFEIRGVLPGAYWLTAQLGGKTARAEVDVAGKDLEDVPIAFLTGFDVPIRISLVGQPDGPNLDRLLDALEVSLDPSDGPENYNAEEVPGQPPGTFIARNVVPGEYHLAWSLSGDSVDDAYMKSVLVEGVEVSEKFRLDRAPVRPIEVVWGLGTGVITGTVRNSRLEPAADVTVVALGRNNYHTTSGRDGSFKISGVREGDFRVFAWEAIKLYSWQDSDVMKRDFAKGITIHVDDGGTAHANLTSIPPPVPPGK